MAANRYWTTSSRLAALITLLFCASGWATTSGLELAPIQVPAYAPGTVVYRPGQHLSYQVSWAGIPAAYAVVSLRQARNRREAWVGEVQASTNRLVDVFYRMRASLAEEFSAATLDSQAMLIRQRENSRTTDYSIAFDRAHGVVRMVRRTPHATRVRQFSASHPVGPISGALLALSQPLTPGERLLFDVFVGSNRYIVRFDVEARERIWYGGEQVAALRVTPTLVYLSDRQDHYKIGRVVIWLSTDARHLPLRIEAETPFGRVLITAIAPGQEAADSVPKLVGPGA